MDDKERESLMRVGIILEGLAKQVEGLGIKIESFKIDSRLAVIEADLKRIEEAKLILKIVEFETKLARIEKIVYGTAAAAGVALITTIMNIINHRG